MDEIIRISENGDKFVVDARELHVFLGNKAQFTNWINIRIKTYKFIEGEDFVTFKRSIKRKENTRGASTRKEYKITIDMAKQLCMIENNDKGRQARKYFIAVEEKAVALWNSIPQSFSEALALASRQAKEIEDKKMLIAAQEKTIEIQAPRAEYAEKVLESPNTYTITSIAKELGLGPVTLNRKLVKKKVIYFRDKHYVPHHKYQDKGYMKFRTITYTDDFGVEKTSLSTRWTESGRQFIHSLFNKDLFGQTG